MNDFCKNIIRDLDNEINDLSIELNDSLVLYEIVIDKILKKIAEIKGFVLKRGFINEEEEIHFFKRIKPAIISKLIFYNTIYKIEIHRPYGGDRIIRKYLNDELSKLKQYFDCNLEFYKYYRTNSTYVDQKYFVRGKHDIKLNLDSFYFELDKTFSTSHDYKVAKIIAYDLIQVYIENQLCNAIKKNNPAALHWTASKTALIELIYALYAKGVFENGNTDIKLIAKAFELTFSIDLGDFYHTYLEIRNRKINRTKFLDTLKEGLLRKMDEQEEK